ALAETVDVHDRAEVVEPMELRALRSLPYRPFRHLAVAEQHVRAIARSDAPRVERDAHARRQALAERARRDVHPRQTRRGMALEVAVELTQGQRRLARDDAHLR